MQLARVILRVRSPDRVAGFYEIHLGMTAWREDDAIILGYGTADAKIELRQAASPGNYEHASTDRYWKIGIALPNLDIAHAQLHKVGVAISNQSQFKDIGYMCHLSDPEGFSIELLQHSFLGHRGKREGNPDDVLGGGAHIGQITLRVTDLKSALDFYRGKLGMKLLSIQPVEDYGFTLYFLAFTDENPPIGDLAAVENREWLWKRPYTTLELQHVHGGEVGFDLPGNDDPGFDGVSITGNPVDKLLHDEAGGKVYLSAQ